MTLNDFAKLNSSEYMLKREIRMIFLGGKHYLSQKLNLSGVENVRMVPANIMREFYNNSAASIEVIDSDMIFDSVGSLTLENLTIIGTNLILENTPKRHADISFVRLTKSTLLHRFTPEIKKELTQPDDDTEALYSNATAPPHMNIKIEKSVFEDGSGTGLQVVDQRLHGDVKILIKNSSISNYKQGGIIIESTTKIQFEITDSVIENNSIGSGRNVYSAAAGLGVYSSRPDGARVVIRGTFFANNQDLRGYPSVVRVSRAVMIEVEDSEFLNNRGTAIRATNVKDSLRLRGNVTFRNNIAHSGAGLALVSTIVDFMPDSFVVFEGNRANHVGGAIFVESSSTMYEENIPNTLVPCFYRFPEMNNKNNVRNLTFGNNSAFEGGHGIYGASLRSYCLVDKMKPHHEYPVRSGDKLIQDSFLFNETTDEYTASLISSQPSRVCVVDSEHLSDKLISEFCANSSRIFMTLSAYPGEEFHIDVMLVGAEFGTSTGEVHAQFLPLHDSEPRLQSLCQHSQRVNHLNSPKTLSYSVFSNNAYEVLVLTTMAGTMLAYGDKDRILEDIDAYNSSNVIPVGLLTTPIYINVTFSKCPSGFYLDSTISSCKCNPQVCSEADGENSEAEQQRGLLHLGENLWVNAYDDGSVYGVIVHFNCPYDYCKSSSNGIDLSNPDTQCAMDHAGVLCGKCETGYSMGLGTDRCLRCSNNNIALILFFGLAGFFLVFVLHILNLTISQGTLSGLLFYVNIIWAYRTIFFAQHEDWFLKMFVAWLNLDFGIEACFSKGLTAYGKSWMQYMFPLYVWLIAVSIMLLVYNTEKLAKRFGNHRPVRVLVWISNFVGNNSTQVMATLFIMSYAKLLRVSIIALVPAHLYVYTDSGELVEHLTKMVWAFDGNLTWGQVPHIFLFMLALVVLVGLLLPYTALLFFIQPIMMASERFECARWINRFKPFFEAHTSPLNPQNYFWVGLLLLARFILILTFILSYAGNPSASLIALVIIVVILLVILTYTGRLYNDPIKVEVRFLPKEISFRSMLEVSFLFNLVVVGVSFLAVDFITGNVHTKAVILYISVIIAFFQFIGIIFFHVLCVLRKTTCSPNISGCMRRGGYKNLEADTDTSTNFPDVVTVTGTNMDKSGDQTSIHTAANQTTTSESMPPLKVANEAANGGTTVEYGTTCDSSEQSELKLSSKSTEDKESPPSYSSTVACKSKLTGSIAKQDLSSFSDSTECRKPILKDSTTEKDTRSCYSSFELRKPILTDSTTI